MELQVQSLSVPLDTQLLHRGIGGAQHQPQICLRGGGCLGARGRGLGVHRPPIQTHAAPLGIPLQPVPLPRSKPGLPGDTAPTSVPLHVTLQTQRPSFKCEETDNSSCTRTYRGFRDLTMWSSSSSEFDLTQSFSD